MDTPKIKTLADRAMLVRLARKRLSVSKRDKDLEAVVRSTHGDDSLTVTKHLFRSKDNMVRDLLRSSDEVYARHAQLTLPWIDRGPRLLPSTQYFDYMQEMRQLMASVQSRVPIITANWKQLVRDDILSRGAAASVDDYPDEYDVPNLFGFDLQVYPLPDTQDFRVDVDPETIASLEDALQHAEQVARNDVIQRMLEPIARAAEKLAVPIGKEGSVFRDSLVSNLFAGIEQAKSLNITEDPALAAMIQEVDTRVKAAVGTPDALRTAQEHRSKAADELNDLLSKLGTL